MSSDDVAHSLKSVANAITPLGTAPGHDEHGTVASLTEAAMGISFALGRIASSINGLTEAVESMKDD